VLTISALVGGVPNARASDARPAGRSTGGSRRSTTRSRTSRHSWSRTEACNRGTWLLFEATRALDIARLELRNVRIWGVAPDELRLPLLGPTPEERAVAEARARYRRLATGHAGHVVHLGETLRTRLAALQLARAELVALLAHTHGTPTPSWSGGGTPTAGEWARAFLAKIGAPRCGENRVLVVAWQAQEGSWMASTARHHARHDGRHGPQQRWRGTTALSQACRRETLQEGRPYGYETSCPPCAPATPDEGGLVRQRPAWCRGCTGGAYLTALPAVRADYLYAAA
jgi:hypothetical protein